MTVDYLHNYAVLRIGEELQIHLLHRMRTQMSCCQLTMRLDTSCEIELFRRLSSISPEKPWMRKTKTR